MFFYLLDLRLLIGRTRRFSVAMHTIILVVQFASNVEARYYLEGTQHAI